MRAFRSRYAVLPFTYLALVFPSLSNAEIQMLADDQLSNHSGQAGLTIDISAMSQFSEFDYVDAGHLHFPAINVGGHGNTGGAFYTDKLDNLRVNVSLAANSASNADYEYGFSQMRDFAQSFLAHGNSDANTEFATLAAGKDPLRGHLDVDERKRYKEGDLVVHLNYLDPFEKDGGFDSYRQGDGISGDSFDEATLEEAEALASKAIDFSYSINEVDMAFNSNMLGFSSSTETSPMSRSATGGGGATNTTRMMSDFHVQGYLGPHDLHLQEFHRVTELGEEVDSTGISWNSYFRVTDLDVYLDIAGIQIKDVKIHNDRGDLSGINLETNDGSEGNSSFGFAHAQREIYSLDDSDFVSPFDDKKKKKKKGGIAFNTRFKGDIDIGHLSFGDTDVSIGEFYITDFYYARRLKIQARD